MKIKQCKVEQMNAVGLTEILGPYFNILYSTYTLKARVIRGGHDVQFVRNKNE